jgi:outer membrane protein assembly factor BamB
MLSGLRTPYSFPAEATMNIFRFASLTFLCLCYGSVSAEDWLRFRGPAGSGVSTETKNLPTKWSPDANLAWKTELPGAGVSSPIVVGDRVFITCYSGYGLQRNNPGDIKNLKRHLVCLDATSGKKIWQQDVAAVLPEDPYSGIGVTAHGYASHTPVSDGKLVFAFYGKSGVYAYDLDGKELWNSNVGKESDPWKWGTSSSPVVHGDLVIVTASAESQAIVGLDKKTGKEVWRQEAEGLDGMWGTPTLIKVDDSRTDLVMSVAKEIWGLNPENGKLRWWCDASGAEQAHTSAVSSDGVVFAFTGRGGGSAAVEVGGKGDVTESNLKWTGKDTARFGSPIVHQSKVYLVGNGVVKAIDRETGKSVDQIRLKGSRRGGGGMFGSLDYCSPVIAGDHLYYLKGNGQMFVLSVGDELRQVAVNDITIDTEQFGGTPAISDGRMFLRSNKHVYCVTDKGEQVDPQKVAKNDSQAESDDAETPRRRPGGFGRGGRRNFDPTTILAQRDANKDGKLTKDELQGSPLATRMRQMDTDKDQAVSKAELEAGIRTFFGRGGRGGGGGGRGGFGRGGERKDTRPDRPQRPELDS